MRIVKGLALILACLAMAVSVLPLFADDVQDPGSGTGGTLWTVVCTYNGQEQLISKTCTSGGSSSCNCP